MFLTLLGVTFLIAVICSAITAQLFDRSIRTILDRVVAEDRLSAVWHRYVKFAIYVVGISGGVRIWDLEKYITPQTKGQLPIVLNSDRWVLEVYRTIIGTLQSVAWMLLLFFVVALIGFVIVKAFEVRGESKK
jgi:hypothetical protein